MTRGTREALGDRKWREGCALEDAGKIAEAVRAYRVGAKAGDVAAQVNLANLLDDHVKPPRRAEAVHWYKRAIRWGDSSAAYNLAIHYKNLSKPRWYRHWLKVSAQMGDVDSARELRKVERAKDPR
jgi:TPR repeat protein